LELIESEDQSIRQGVNPPAHERLIPSAVKLEVWQRDKGQCVLCGSKENLHFDHDLPYSKGGSSLTAANIRLLCAKHNLSKGAKIQ
jgi:5-methylcytosine-specific restriction endonuclease McrA